MSFSCNQCDASFTSARDLSTHTKGDHVAMSNEGSDEEVRFPQAACYHTRLTS